MDIIALLVPTTIGTAQLQLPQDIVLAAKSSVCCKNLTVWLTLIATRCRPNKSNSKRTAYRARADRAGEVTQQSLRWPRRLG
jgi:hypothetical protein